MPAPEPVSYTHLDVYKRQEPGSVGFRVRHADVSPGREGFQSGEHQARAEGRPGLEDVYKRQVPG